jgi:hypothetical protein
VNWIEAVTLWLSIVALAIACTALNRTDPIRLRQTTCPHVWQETERKHTVQRTEYIGTHGDNVTYVCAQCGKSVTQFEDCQCMHPKDKRVHGEPGRPYDSGVRLL